MLKVYLVKKQMMQKLINKDFMSFLMIKRDGKTLF